MTALDSRVVVKSDYHERFSPAKWFATPKLVLLIALVLFALMTGVASAQPPDPPLAPNPLLWIGPPRDVGPVSIVERERALSKLGNFLQAVSLRQDPFATIDACVQQEMARLAVPGTAIAIALDGEMVYERGYGVKHREEGGAVDSNTLFRIGSTTKMMTAAAVMQQVDRGTVDLQTPVTDYVPEFDVSGPWPASDMTVWNLLTHSTGFPDRLYLTDIDGPQTETALTEWAGTQSEVRLYAPPGSFWNYSNPNFSLAGLVAERASGTPYHQYVENNVWATAGMTRTMFLPSEALAYGNYTYGHFTDPFTGEPVIIAPDAYDNWWAAPAGYAFSTPGDLVKWALLLMDGGGAVLSPESAAAMQAEQIWIHYTPTQYYGFGVLADEFWGVETRDHAGNVPGWGSTLLWVPEHNFAVSVLGNTTSSMYSSLYCATAVMLGLQPPQDPPDYSTNPDTWGRYVGTYHVLDYEVLDPAGIEFQAVVTKEDDDLRLTFPTLRDPLTLTAPYSRTLTQAFLDTFLFDINLDGTPDLDLTFIDDPEAPGEVKWMRNRVFVGTRATVPQGTDTLTVRAFVDYRCDGFFQSGLDAPLPDASVRLSFPNGAWITRQVRPFGLVNFSGFDATDGVAVTVDLPEGYQGYALGHCPNSPGNIRLQSDDFQFGYKLVQFGAGVAGEAAGP